MIIGISGKIGSGKDTLASLLMLSYPYFKEKSYAYKLKYVTSFLTGIPLEETFTQEGKNKFLYDWGMTVGEFQQKLGTEAMRMGLHEDGWVIALFSDYKENKNWIITDVRFPNEAKAIKDRNGILIRLEGDPAKIRENSKRDLNHPSETSLDNYSNWDYVFNNTGTIKDLQNFAEHVLKNEQIL